MPRFTVVVPVHEARGLLRECMESVLRQRLADVEVIGVDDGSADGSGRLLDELAAADPRVRAVHLAAPVSAGERRDAGAGQARGEYLLFLEPGLVQLPGALDAIDGRLKAAGDPDILLFGHLRTPFLGTPEPTRSLDVLRATGDAVTTASARPDLLGVAPVSWNRAVRREFWRDGSPRFGPGERSEAMWALGSLVAAGSVAALATPCVDHRQQRPLPGARRDRREVVAAYDTLLADVAARPGTEALRGPLYALAVRELLKTYAGAHEQRRAYVRAVAAFSRTHRPTGHRPGGGRSGVRGRLLTEGRSRTLAALDRALAARRRVRSRARALRKSALRAASRHYYRLQRLLPLDPHLAVYASYWNRGVSCNPAAVHRKAAELAPHIKGVWVVAKAEAADGHAFVLPDTLAYWRLMARATYFVNNVNFPDHLVKRPGQLHLQTHHGTPLKRMGLDQLAHPAAAKGFGFRRLLGRVDRWDWSLSANPHSTETWSRVYPSAVRHLESGYPRNDVYATATAESVAAARRSLGIAPGRRAILYAPTHREYERGFSGALDLVRVADALGPDTLLLVRAHYFYASAGLPEHPGLLDVSAHPRVEELCLAADALVTDYSSVMFDYADLDRPIVVHAPDWEVYRTVRGVCFDLLSGRPGDTPGAVTTSTDELISCFRDGSWDSRANAGLRAAFRERFCPYDDGRAAERVVRAVFLGEPADALPPVEPARRTVPPQPGARRVSAAGRPSP
ncbi:CDP-glycerol glycerophosphotransferase family protein [Streptomyces sp. BPTC-684]|uniref:bifunctional glycosyltransferase/CDP-glycerol:glycerophosphate glycerophosphotransferase n=1 Tax=Streptomyces sp. BPTC-684 TaxID=3043734 RepID=UPI0024B16EA3|nr:CDP-glycerol glycerophosphotransferase family protein [Streptomyces sp. BPTC-684]WHM38482.1 CDP-glycerol glycerophosphotransferase family protein [Streptomyces sp. BPTC-684]